MDPISAMSGRRSRARLLVAGIAAVSASIGCEPPTWEDEVRARGEIVTVVEGSITQSQMVGRGAEGVVTLAMDRLQTDDGRWIRLLRAEGMIDHTNGEALQETFPDPSSPLRSGDRFRCRGVMKDDVLIVYEVEGL